MGCCASAASTKKTEHTTATQLPRLGILCSHLTAERSILVAPQGLRPMRYSLKAPALSVCAQDLEPLLALSYNTRCQTAARAAECICTSTFFCCQADPPSEPRKQAVARR